MANYNLYKVFEWKNIPNEIIKSYNIESGNSMLFYVIDNELGDWFLENGALQGEAVFVFRG